MMVTMTRGQMGRNALRPPRIARVRAGNRPLRPVVEEDVRAAGARSRWSGAGARDNWQRMVRRPDPRAELSPEVSTTRLRLWVAGPHEAAELLRHHDDNREHLARWSPPAPADVYTLAYWQSRCAISRRDCLDGRAVRFAIAWRSEPDRIIGTCSFTDIVRGPVQACQLGYGLDRREQGKGVMTEALQSAIAFAFGPLAIHRITASYMPANVRSGKLLERLGFAVEGCARAALFIDGAWRDHVLTALINPRPISPAR
jgi:ribosomal-protein-alanine N-acetyltransferase